MALTQVSRGLLSTSIVDNGNATAITIDSSENVLVGKENTTFSTAGSYLASGGNAYFTSSNNQLLALNRLSTDGSLIEFYKDTTTTVGSIGVGDGDNLYISGSAGSTKGLIFNDNSVIPAANGYNVSDNTTNLGSSSGRFKDLYLSGGVYLGGTTAANKLDDYEEGTWTPVLKRNDGTVNATATFSNVGYVRIGKLVTIRAWVRNISVGSSDGSSFWIITLPFTNAVAYSAMTLAYNTSQVESIYVTGNLGVLSLNGAAYTSNTLTGGFMITLTFESTT